MNLKRQERAVRFFQEKLEFTIGPVELKHRMGEHDMLVLDVRDEADYRRGHIPGAVSLPRERWETFTGFSLTGRNVVYCYSQPCHLAAAACLRFARQGFHMMEMEGGMEAWKHAGYEVEISAEHMRHAA